MEMFVKHSAVNGKSVEPLEVSDGDYQGDAGQSPSLVLLSQL